MAVNIFRALNKRLVRLESRQRPQAYVVFAVLTNEGNVSSVAMSNGTRLEGEQAMRAYQNVKPGQPCKVYGGFDPDATLGKLPVHGA
jgi:hypothetical protein